MRILSDVSARLRSLWSLVTGRSEDRDLATEIRFHIEKLTEKNIAAGMTPQEARRQAHIKFGGVERMRGRTREARGIGAVETLVQDFRVAVRSLSRSPGLTATVVLTLAVGIGANTAVFTALDTVLLEPLPYPQSDRLVLLEQVQAGGARRTLSAARLQDWNEMNRTFQSLTGYYVQDVSESSGDLPERLRQARVAPRFLETLGIEPALGRDFTSEELRFGGPSAVLISDVYWRRRFGADPQVIGRSLDLGESSPEIVGVMPPDFEFPDAEVDLWVPAPPDSPGLRSRGLSAFRTTGRLMPGVTLARARSDLSAVQEELGDRFPETDSELGVAVQSLKQATVANAGTSLWFLYGAVSLLLLITCTNVAALLLSRATQRRHEVAVRYTLGASRGSVMLQKFTEASVLALGGGVLGLAAAGGASRVFQSLAADLPRIQEMSLDWRIVLYTLACSGVVTALCGILPAVVTSRRDTRGTLAQSGRSQVSGGSRWQWLLVGSQVALAVTLLSATGLLLRSYWQLDDVAPGFDASRVVALNVSAAWSETNDMPSFVQWSDRTLDRLQVGPGIESAAISYGLPGLRSTSPVEWEILDRTNEGGGTILAATRFVSPEYFETLGIPLLTGRLCERDREGLPTGMVNRSFVERYLGGIDPSSIRVREARADGEGPGIEIRGVVGDARENSLRQEPTPTVYACGALAYPGYHFLVRVGGDPASMAPALRRRVDEVAPGRAAFGITPLQDHLSETLAEDRLRTALLSFFALTAVLLASLGLYGTLGYFVGVRRREVGLRMALGARRTSIVSDFLTTGLKVSAVGAALGLLLALAFGRVMEGMLYQIAPSDPVTLAGVTLLVFTVTGAAALVPSLRASRVEPMRVLRDE